MKKLLKSLLIISFIAIFIGFILYKTTSRKEVEFSKEEEIKGETVDLTASVKLQQINFTVYPEKREPDTGNWATVVDFIVRNQTTGALYFETNTSTNASGNGTIVLTPLENIPSGNHRVYIKGYSHLTKRYNNIPFKQQFQTLNFTTYEDLKAGDTHDSSDDLINSLDVSTIVGLLATGNYRNDLNQDTQVNSLDVSNLVFNFAESGDV